MRLTERDYKILLALEKWGILGLGQLDGLLFHVEKTPEERIRLFLNSQATDGYRGRAYKGMVRLERSGHVRAHQYTNLSKLYTLTGRGHRVLREEFRARLPEFRAGVAESLVRHELMVNAAGLVLSECLGLEVSTEIERYSTLEAASRLQRTAFPDLWVAEVSQPKAVEIERTLKSAERYRALWRIYECALPRESVVLYITLFPNGPQTLLRLARRFLADFIYVASLADFTSSQGRCRFLGYRGGVVSFVQPAAEELPAPLAVEA